MKFVERTYVGSEAFRPRPFVSWIENPNGIIIITPWGKCEDESKDITKIIQDQIATGFNPESTNPFEHYPALGNIGNHLKISLSLVNNYIVRNQNKSEYTFAVEIMVMIFDKKTIHWAAVGLPNAFVKSERELIPLHYPQLWTSRIQVKAPLPSQGLGLFDPYLPSIGNYPFVRTDKIFFVCRSWIPRSFYGLIDYDISSIQECLTDEDPQEPFWIGFIENDK